MTMQTATLPRETRTTSVPQRPVLVALDPARRNLAAVHWASAEALGTGRPLQLVAVMSRSSKRITCYLSTLAAQLRDSHPGLTVDHQVHRGLPAQVLVELGATHDMVVVGHRAAGTASRLVTGSTASAVAESSPVPVVIVPDLWPLAESGEGPVLAGLTFRPWPDQALRYAFAEAERRRTSLWIVPLDGLDTSKDGARRFDQRLSLLRAAHNWLPVHLVTNHHPSLQLLLQEAFRAQLLVLGRGDEGLQEAHHAVLRDAAVPVAIVPAT